MRKQRSVRTTLLIDFGPLRQPLRDAAAAQLVSEAALVRAAVRSELRRLARQQAVSVPGGGGQDDAVHP